jgi:hypothetical protein
MSTWALEDLERIGNAEEIQIAPDRPDGAPGPATTIWVVSLGDDLYVRAGRGPSGSWYRHATAAGQGGIRAGALQRAVAFEANPPVDPSAIDDAYRTKYASYAETFLPVLISADARAATLRLVPR